MLPLIRRAACDSQQVTVASWGSASLQRPDSKLGTAHKSSLSNFLTFSPPRIFQLVMHVRTCVCIVLAAVVIIFILLQCFIYFHPLGTGILKRCWGKKDHCCDFGLWLVSVPSCCLLIGQQVICIRVRTAGTGDTAWCLLLFIFSELRNGSGSGNRKAIHNSALCSAQIHSTFKILWCCICNQQMHEWSVFTVQYSFFISIFKSYF